MKKVAFIIIGVVVLVAIYFVLRGGGKKNIEIVTTKIEKGEISDIITATGTLKALNTVDVGTQVSGVIDEIMVDFNDNVKKGQIIARLDTKTLSANVQDAQSALERARIQLEQTKLIYERAKKLYADKLISKEELERAEFEFQNASVSVKSAQVQVSRASVNIGYATISSPIDGVVISRNVSKGQTVAAAFSTPTLFSIANDLTSMLIEADIDEADIGKVKVGQRVEFFVDAFQNDNFNGIVKQVRLQPKSIQNVVNYTVVIEVKNPDLKLFPGMTANISIIVEDKKGILITPTSALNYILPDELPLDLHIVDTTGYDENEISNRARVWMKEGNTLRATIVETGITDGSTTEIISGIKPGTEIVTGIDEKKENVIKKKSPLVPNLRKPSKK
jgi:HlyD family secretion protein